MPQFVSTQIGKGTVLQTPTADGTTGQFLKTDGAGNLSFDTVAANPAGSDTQLQFNDGGSFGGSANLTWDDATFQVTGTSTTAPTLIAKLPASATDNAFEVQDSTSAVLARINSAGEFSYPLNNANNEGFGAGIALGSLGENVAVGNLANANNWRGTSIGYNAQTSQKGVAVGARAIGSGQDAVAIGYLSLATARRSVAIGDCSVRHFDSCGIHGEPNAQHQLVFGGAPGSPVHYFSDVYFGGGVINPTQYNVTLHATGGSGTDVAGADMTIAGGAGTGTGTGGHLIFQTAPAGGTGSSLNSLATMLELTDDRKIGFFAATPVVQQAGTGETTGFTAGAGTAVNDDSTFTGNVGTAAYRISDIVKALKNYGLLAAS